MITIIYGIIIILATFLGAFVGLGGGVIIKPMLDLIGQDTIDTVNFISSCAVFTMSISSIVRHLIAKTKIDFKIIIEISVGAICGGMVGNTLFNALLDKFGNNLMKGIQGIILGTLLVFSVIYVNLKNKKSFNIKNPIGVVVVGLSLGLIASFLGVGGGPINVAFLVLFFSMSMKEAAVYSVGTIFFSQLSKLSTTIIASNIPNVKIETLLVAIVCATLGGILGTKANKLGNEKAIKIVFTVFVTGVAMVNFYNGINGLI